MKYSQYDTVIINNYFSIPGLAHQFTPCDEYSIIIADKLRLEYHIEDSFGNKITSVPQKLLEDNSCDKYPSVTQISSEIAT